MTLMSTSSKIIRSNITSDSSTVIYMDDYFFRLSAREKKLKFPTITVNKMISTPGV